MHAGLLPCGGRRRRKDGWWVRHRLQVSYLYLHHCYPHHTLSATASKSSRSPSGIIVIISSSLNRVNHHICEHWAGRAMRGKGLSSLTWTHLSSHVTLSGPRSFVKTSNIIYKLKIWSRPWAAISRGWQSMPSTRPWSSATSLSRTWGGWPQKSLKRTDSRNWSTLFRTAKIFIKDIYKIDQLKKLVPTLLRTAKISIWLSGVAITVILSIVAYAGLIIYTRYLSLLYIFIRIRSTMLASSSIQGIFLYFTVHIYASLFLFYIGINLEFYSSH